MPQGFSGFFQFAAQLPLIQGPADRHGQMSDMLSFNEIERPKSGKLCHGFTARSRGHEQKRDLLHCLMEELQCTRSFPAWAWILGDNHIIRVGAELRCALRQVQNYVGVDSELRFFELFQTIVHDVCIAVDEKDA
jgi:hypothetical protein